MLKRRLARKIRCAVCGRPLHGDASKEAGVGPCCAMKIAKAYRHQFVVEHKSKSFWQERENVVNLVYSVLGVSGDSRVKESHEIPTKEERKVS